MHDDFCFLLIRKQFPFHRVLDLLLFWQSIRVNRKHIYIDGPIKTQIRKVKQFSRMS